MGPVFQSHFSKFNINIHSVLCACVILSLFIIIIVASDIISDRIIIALCE